MLMVLSLMGNSLRIRLDMEWEKSRRLMPQAAPVCWEQEPKDERFWTQRRPLGEG